jgi:plastocyanin
MAKNALNRILGPAVAAFVLSVAAVNVNAETLQVRVVDVNQEPVPDVTIYVEQIGSSRDTRPPVPAVMDQRGQRFVPHILVVQKGTEVAFPNSDVVAHHVYSFSQPNNFTLPLYKGTPPEPVRFDHDGIVTLGCNIHDNMLAFIVVVDTDIYAKTDDEGVVTLEVDPDATAWNVHAWSPRFKDSRTPLVQEIRSGETLSAEFVLQSKLRPPHQDIVESILWNDY